MGTLLYLDSWMAIIAKDAGEAVQSRTDRDATVVARWRRTLGDPSLQAAHRIDQPVSGLVILARNTGAFRDIQESFRTGKVTRHYLAVVTTPPEPREGTLEDALLPRGTGSVVVERGTPGSRVARLHYRTMGSTDHHTILLVTLDTGRHHQIRAQLAHRRWHVAGDARYGARRPMRDRSIALHSWFLSLPHPGPLQQTLTLSADLPDTSLWNAVKEGLHAAEEPVHATDAYPAH